MPKKTVGFLGVVAVFLGGGATAHAAICAAGYYLNNGSCSNCSPGYEPYYCPGDDVRHPCPTTDTDYNQFGYTFFDGSEANWASPQNNSSIFNCAGSLYFRDSDGNSFLLEVSWNGENYWSDDQTRYLWYDAGWGFYLSGYRNESWKKWYHNVRPCTNAPAHAHYTGPGTPDAPDGSITDANDCPWECDAGYGRVGDVCQPLCTAGVTQIHAGTNTAPLFPVKYTTPTLVIRTPGGICYGNLTAGHGTGIHVTVGGTTYRME